ncbi:site-specific DNA-methyltransferase [uncultured Gemmiger sp.]|uniref:site-specific DNA-methyltransferase n=1 Tax=uncultured Gemmiger sp. TaxID=1623490 RepID=UPI0025D9B279|nr:site-specific DNA-methyltransferase [uncultured Gemmiger sp.]
MEKLKMQTANKADENFKKLAAMFPNAVTETINENGEVVRAIDKDVLMQEISCKVVDGNEERYQFTWPDKKKSVLLANAPINRTLRPVREDETVPTGADSEGKPYCSTGSVDFDTTENLYIEGDNLEVLKLLQETYLGKIKMIYIDPPYNTGNDFVYEDDFAQNTDEYLANSGQFDEEGNRMVQNTESNGRFHTDWLNMIYPRLKLAKDLLADDGAIFISIDDNEVKNLMAMCDEVFGTSNFLATFVWQKKYGPANDAKGVSATHEYILLYGKNSDVWMPGLLPRSDEQLKAYKNPDNDPRGVWRASDLSARTYSASCDYIITGPTGLKFSPPPSRSWIVNKESYQNLLADNRITFGSDGTGRPMQKKFITEVKGGITPETWLPRERGGDNKIARYELKDIFPENLFDTPKPSKLVSYLITISGVEKDAIILDFFSGSATTAHAVMQLNAEDGGHRKFIMVQLPEKCDEKSEAYKAGYKTICEIGKERIRRAGAKIKEEAGLAAQNLDTGFRVLKCDTSNMKDVYYNPAEYEVNMFSRLEDNIKEDRTPEDLLFQVMLDLGVLLSSKIEETTIAGKKVFNVEDNYLIACFDSDVSEETIKAIAKQKPYYFVMRDSSMASDSVATNFDQIFATYSPDTVRKVL